MDLNDTAAEAIFRAEARAFLNAHAEPRDCLTSRLIGFIGPEQLPAAKAWQALKAKHGFVGITLPRSWGGREANPIMEAIYYQEEQAFSVPEGVFDIGIGMCIPALIQYGNDEQKQRLVPAALNGDEIWCQLFSEPAAGSDLAGLRTRAVRDGDDWIVNGQKIWTSGAHLSDWGILVARSDPSVPKHKGLTFFFVDMRSHGIEIRPIRQMSGHSHFNEVFFTDVRIPDTQRLGAVGDGWRVTISTLMNERVVGALLKRPPEFDDLLRFVHSLSINGEPALANSAIRDKLASWYVRAQGVKLINLRTLTALSKGGDPGPENSVGKLVKASMAQDMATYGLSLMDAGGLAMHLDLPREQAFFQEALLGTPGPRIAGGTDEILRNTIAERVLKMPTEERSDKEVPFNSLQTKI